MTILNRLVYFFETWKSYPSVSAVVAATLLWGISRTFRRWDAHELEDQLVAEKGVKALPRLQYRWPLALDLVVEAFKADRDQTILHWFDGLIRSTHSLTFDQLLLGARGVDTIDPVNIEAVLNSQFDEFGLGTRSDNFRPLLGHGIFTQDGPDWKMSRELLRPQFMNTRSKYLALIQKEVESMVENLLHMKHEEPVDLQPLFFRLTLHTTTGVLFGKTSNTSTSINSEADAFADAFDEAQHMLARRGRLGGMYWLMGGRKFREDCRTLHRYVDEIVQAALTADVDKSSMKGDQSQYIFLRALMTRTKDPIALRDQLINILLAGRDTTACCLSWTFRLLAEHNDVQRRLREECINLPSFSAGSSPTKDELKQMDYLEVVIREVLRLYPSVPVNAREAVVTTTIPHGGGPDGQSPVLIRKGEAVGYNVYSMHRSEHIYGPDAHIFRPERWIKGEENSVEISKVGWGYLPFNGGPRTCLGQEFGLLEAKYAIVRLLQTFASIELVVPRNLDAGLEKQNLTLVVASADGCKVRMIAAQDDVR